LICKPFSGRPHRLQGQVLDTPCVESRTLSQIVGAQVFLKFENLQFTASFKERGACNKLCAADAMPSAPRRGGHERRQPCAGRGLPRAAPGPAGGDRDAALHAHVKVERTRGFGAEVVLHGDTLERGARPRAGLAAAQG
jgi:threonine dehydratase